MDFLSADSLVLAFLIAVLKMEVSWSFSAIPWQNWPRFVPLFFGKSLFQMGHLQFQELVRLSSCFLNFPIQDCNYIYYIYTIYIYIHIYIWDLGILGSCHVLQEAVGRVFGTRRSHGTGHPHVIWHERSATFFRRSRCHAAMLSSHWDPAEFQLSLNGDTLSHT